MKLNGAIVCSNCEEIYSSQYEECPSCLGRHHWHLRDYVEPLFKFGGPHETVSIRNNGLQKKLPSVQTYHLHNAVDGHSYSDDGKITASLPQAPHTLTISQRSIDEAGPVAKAGGLDYTSRVLGEAISRLLKICRGLDASPSSDMEAQMEQKAANGPGA